jgi:hypothetical protein
MVVRIQSHLTLQSINSSPEPIIGAVVIAPLSLLELLQDALAHPIVGAVGG